jgi:hypothetical protein
VWSWVRRGVAPGPVQRPLPPRVANAQSSARPRPTLGHFLWLLGSQGGFCQRPEIKVTNLGASDPSRPG